MINAELIGGKIICPPADYEELKKQGYGGRKTDIVSPLETLYLVKNKQMQVAQAGKKIPFSKLKTALKKTDPDLERRFLVYSDLRDRGYLPKSGFKFGCDFNVYPVGVLPADPGGHGKFLVKVIKPKTKITIQDLALRVRLAQNVKKQLYFACAGKKQAEYIRVKYITP